jgi:hypothetical protein
MMELYGMRLKIEAALDSPENPPQGFSRRFWSESTPKMRCLDYRGVQAALEAGLDEKAKSGVFNPLRAIEAFFAFSGVALGMVQMVSAEYSSNCKINYTGMQGLQIIMNFHDSYRAAACRAPLPASRYADLHMTANQYAC